MSNKMKGLRSTIKSDIDLKKIVKGLNTNKVLKKAQTIKKVGKIQFRNSVKLDHAFLDYQQKPQNIFELASDKSIKVDSKSKKEDDDIFKSETFYFLNNLPLFKELSCTKDQSLYLKDSFISTGILTHNTPIYNQGDKSDVFVVIKQGNVLLKTKLVMQTITRIPTNVKKWEVNETSETLEYTLGLLGPGDFFGHQELYTGDKRWTQAKSIGLRTELCFIKINLFLKFFSKFQDK